MIKKWYYKKRGLKKFRVEKLDGTKTDKLTWQIARNHAAIFGGKIINDF